MPHTKESDTRPRVNPDEYDLGDSLTVEFGEWNGQAFEFTNYKDETDALVVGIAEDSVTVVDRDDRLDWIDARLPDGDQSEYETTIHASGDVEGTDKVVKAIETHPPRGGEHMVTHGL